MLADLDFVADFLAPLLSLVGLLGRLGVDVFGLLVWRPFVLAFRVMGCFGLGLDGLVLGGFFGEDFLTFFLEGIDMALR